MTACIAAPQNLDAPGRSLSIILPTVTPTTYFSSNLAISNFNAHIHSHRSGCEGYACSMNLHDQQLVNHTCVWNLCMYIKFASLQLVSSCLWQWNCEQSTLMIELVLVLLWTGTYYQVAHLKVVCIAILTVSLMPHMGINLDCSLVTKRPHKTSILHISPPTHVLFPHVILKLQILETKHYYLILD